MGLNLITPPTTEPLTLAEVKKDLRIDHSDDDETLNRMISEAREWLERRLQLKLCPQTWDFIIDAFPTTTEIRLPFGPVQSVEQVAYDDPQGIEQIMPPIDYYLDEVSYMVGPEPWLFPTDTWPATIVAINAVRIRFVAGYATGDDVPGPMKSALRLKVRELFDGDDTTGQVDKLLVNYNIMCA